MPNKINFKKTLIEVFLLFLVGVALLVVGKILPNKTLFLIGIVSAALFFACTIAMFILYIKHKEIDR